MQTLTKIWIALLSACALVSCSESTVRETGTPITVASPAPTPAAAAPGSAPGLTGVPAASPGPTPTSSSVANSPPAPPFTVSEAVPTGDNAPAGFDQERAVARGEIVTETYDSKALGFQRKLTVYKPPGYSRDKKYPVLYLLHGSGDDETSWVQKGAANVILDNLYADGKAAPMLVVIPYGFANKPGEPKPGRDTPPEVRRQMNANLVDDLLKDIIPFIDAHYPTAADPSHRAMAGLSMGGGQTMRIGPLHSDTFAWLGVFSAGIRRLPDGTQNDITATYPDAATLNASLKLFWISCGAKDPGLGGAKNLAQILTDKKVNVVWHQDTGAHEWPVWKNDLYLVAQRLFKLKAP